jgi:hypothetical protein
MRAGRSQFVGAAGLFHLARELALRGHNAAITVGNAPSVDVIATPFSGKRSISFQVKTARNAYRKKRYGHEGFEWDVNKGVIGKYNESFWYALVDLQEQPGPAYKPQVFFAPSRWIAEFVRPEWKRFMYFLPKTISDLCLERWDVVDAFLDGKPEGTQWANAWPREKLVQWGNVEPIINADAPPTDGMA